MLLIDKIRQTHFSPSEQAVIKYVIEHKDHLDNLSTQSIAEATFTSAPIVIRAAKKLGLSGWNQFKLQLKSEIAHLYAVNEVDASIPFVMTNTYTDILQHISRLETETINDTLALLTHDKLYKANALLKNSKVIDIYCSHQSIHLVMMFVESLEIINRHARVCTIGDDSYIAVARSDKDHLAIVIPGINKEKECMDIVRRLKHKGTKVLGIIALEDDYLSEHVDCTLFMISRELLSARIGEFASSTSLKQILDVLYACIFSNDYEKNLNIRIGMYKG